MIRVLKYLALAAALLWSPVDAQVIMGGSGSAIGAGGGPPAVYAAVAVDFDGDGLDREGELTGAADGKAGTISFWFRIDGSTGTFRRINGAGDSRWIVNVGNDNKILVRGQNSASSTILSLLSATTYTDSNWHHVIASWNLATPEAYLYIDGADDEGSSTETDDTIDYTLGAYAVGQDPDGTLRWDGCLADYWWDDTFLNITVEANRFKFRDGSGKPVDLGSDGSTPTSAQPLVYLNQNATATWHTNAGTGGGFTEEGSGIADCSTSPSD